MTKTLRFYNRDSRWFADLPEWIEAGGDEDDLEMVAGADEWIDYIGEGKDWVTLMLSDTNELSNKIVLQRKDEFGAVYLAHSYYDEDINHQLWLCNVTLYIFGQFPETIYYTRTH